MCVRADIGLYRGMRPCPPQIRLHSFLVGWRYPLHRFEFQKHLLFNADIDSETLVKSNPPCRGLALEPAARSSIHDLTNHGTASPRKLFHRVPAPM